MYKKKSIYSQLVLFLKGTLIFVFSFAILDVFAQYDNELIEGRLEIYSRVYPEIDFKLLYQLSDYDQLLPLTKSLGEDLSNFDYEHPEELRITLVEAQEYRIQFLLNNGMGSTTMFKTPSSIAGKPYTCLITLSNPMSSQGDLAATFFMYDLDESILVSMPESLRIDNKDFSLYSLDHEVFHCIDVYTNGPLYLQTPDPIKVYCDRARAELRADIFAAMAHLSRQPEGRDFLTNLAHARTLNLLSWDVEHYTAEVLYELAERNLSTYTGDIKALVLQALRFAETRTPTYSDQVQFLTAAMVVVQKFGLDEAEILSDYAVLANEQPESDTVRDLSIKINNVTSAINATL